MMKFFLFVSILFLKWPVVWAETPSSNENPIEWTIAKPCPSYNAVECQSLRQKIQTVWEQIQLARQPNETQQLEELRLNLNELLELYEYLAAENTESSQTEYGSRRDIENKYRFLRQIQQTFRHAERHENDVADAERNRPNIAYHHLEWQAVQQVITRFGPLELYEQDISYDHAPRWRSLEVKQPWSGYWYPKYDPVLHYGQNSVMAKLDRIMTQLGRESRAQEHEKNLLSGILPDSWEGLCNAWSVAATLTSEPTMSIEIFGEVLDVSDQKALLTKMHENFPVEIFGSRYNGDYLTDGTYQDIRPEAFHKLMITFLGHRQTGIVIDEEAGPEVWQKPVYKVDWTITPDKDLLNAYLVTARLWKIDHRWSVSNELTNRTDIGFHNYQYRLYIDPEFYMSTGRRMVIAGEWLGDSRKHHPDYVVVPVVEGQPASFNPSIHNNIDILKDILLRR